MSEEIQEMIDHRTIRHGINGEIEVLLFSILSKMWETILELSAAEKITVSPEAKP